MMSKFEKRAENPDSYEEWKRKRISHQVKRKAEQVDSEGEEELVMAEQHKKLRDISIPPRGIPIKGNLKFKQLIDPTCSNTGGGGQVERGGEFGGGSGDSLDNGAIGTEQRAWVGVRQNLLSKD